MTRASRDALGGKGADSWVQRERRTPSAPKADLYTARLTIDVTPELRARIKLAAFGAGTTVAALLRHLLEDRFPTASDARIGEPRR